MVEVTSRANFHPLRALVFVAGLVGVCLSEATAGAEERELHIAVRQRNEHLLASLLTSVSTPSSPTYGQYLSLPALCDLISPEPHHLAAVEAWAETHGATSIQHTACREFVTIRLPTSSLSSAMRGTPSLSCSPSGCDRPVAVPPALAHAVDFVDGLGGGGGGLRREGRGNQPSTPRSYDPAQRRAEHANDRRLATRGGAKPGPWYPKCAALSVVPDCLKELHNVTVKAAASPKGVSQGVALFGPQFYSPSDLSAFQAKYDVKPNVVHNLNDNKPASPGTEGTLDVEYITGVGAGVDTWYMHYACTTNDCKPFLTWMLQIANVTKPPMVQSVSVGTTEYEYLTEMGEKHVIRMNSEFAKAGLRGISLIFASGDRASQVFDGKFWINFPSGSPHVTAVGGIWLGELGNGPLVADPDTTGGFSNTGAHARMPYQNKAVEDYLAEAAKEGAMQPKTFNASNRGVPDLVSMSDAYVIIQHGTETFVGGTSAACPVIGGMISLLNDARSGAGKPAMGFLNPFLYANPLCFEDITGGHNLYGATKGWDPASGLGSPVFSCLLKAAMAASPSVGHTVS